MSRIILVSDNQAFEQRLRAGLDAAAGDGLQRLSVERVSASPIDFARSVGEEVDVVALGPGLAVDVALKVAAELDATHPTASVLVIAEPSDDVWQQAMDVGVRAVIRPGSDEGQALESFRRALDTAQRRRDVLHPPEEHAPKGRVITVLGPKGGAGKTMLSANLAVGLARANPGDVAVVDLDLQFGDLTSALQLVPEHTIADTAAHRGPLDPTALKVYLTAHPSKLYALAAPATPADGEEVPVGRISETLSLLADEFAAVVIDTAAGVDEQALAAVEQSTDLVLLCTMDVASVRALRKLLDALDQLGMTQQRRHVVLNRADSRVGLSAEDIEATLGTPVHLGLPSSRAVPQSMNEGTTLLEQGGRQRIVRQIEALIERFTNVPGQRGGLLARSTR